MWWWRNVRKANITDDLRQQFERFGETLVALAFASPDVAKVGGTLYTLVYRNADATLAWLTERRDIHERREDRLETVEWAILLFVVVGVVADCAIVAHELGWFLAN